MKNTSSFGTHFIATLAKWSVVVSAVFLLGNTLMLHAADSGSQTVYLGLGVAAAPAPGRNPPENSSALVEGSGDFDGDGRFGADEDSDGDDVFHTIATIPGFKEAEDNIGGFVVPALRYNSLTIVSSGVFREFLRSAHFGSTTIKAAPGCARFSKRKVRTWRPAHAD